MSNYEDPQQQPAFFRFMRLVFIFSLAAITIIGISALIYSLAPVVYRQYVQPVQDHTQQIEAIGDRLDQVNQQNQERANDLVERLEALELQGDRGKQLAADSTDRLAAIETTQAEHALALEAAAQDQEQIAEVLLSLEELQGDFSNLEESLTGLAGEQEHLINQTSGMLADLDEARVSGAALTAELALVRQELALLKSMELLTRARFNLLAGNLSLARADLEAAQDLVTGLQETAEPGQIEALVELDERLEQSLETLAASPLSAADYIESAWQLLAEGLFETVEATPAPPAATTTPSPTGQP